MTDSGGKRLGQALRAAYREKEATDVSDFWKSKTMARIREKGDALTHRFPSRMDLALRLTWRFAGAAAAVALIVGIFAYRLDWNPDMAMARLYLQDPIEFAILETIGIL